MEREFRLKRYFHLWGSLVRNHTWYGNSVLRKYCVCLRKRGRIARNLHPACLFVYWEGDKYMQEIWNSHFTVFVEQAKKDHIEWVMESYLE